MYSHAVAAGGSEDAETPRFQIYSHATVLGGRTRIMCWNFKTIYGSSDPSRNRVVVPSRQATSAGGIDSVESIPGLLQKYRL
jgi:hypothetical protein